MSGNILRYKHVAVAADVNKNNVAKCSGSSKFLGTAGEKIADVSMPTQTRFGFMQHSVKYLMPTEGKESSAKV